VPDEPVVFPRKTVATKVKHWILERCLTVWGGIIVNSNSGEVRFSFVDTCCGSGLYESSDDDTEPTDGKYEAGSALIGPQELAKIAEYARKRRRPVKTRALLINAERKELETAEKAIREAGLDKALTEIAFEARPLEDVQQLVSRYTHNWFSFVFIDPFGPSPTPFSVVSEIVRGKYTDTLINFPFYSLQKWTRFLDRARTLDEDAKLAAADAFMGGTEWRAIVQRARSTKQPLEAALIEHYLERLAGLGVFALALPLLFQDRERVMYHLVFTSHNVAGLSSAKQRFLEAESQQFKLRQDLRLEAEVSRTGTGFLFAPPEPKKAEVDIPALANYLLGRFKGRTVTMEQVILAGLRVPLALESDVRKALRTLKKVSTAQYSETKYRDQITFKSQTAKK